MSAEDMTIKPTIETVLERINALGEQLSQEFNSRIDSLKEDVNKRIDSLKEDIENRIDLFKEHFDGRINGLQGQIDEIRATLNDDRTILRDIKRKIQALNDNVLQLQADQNDIRDRVEKLESKPS